MKWLLKTTQRIKETKPLTKVAKRTREKTQINETRDERGGNC
jgi:hypothetical protein